MIDTVKRYICDSCMKQECVEPDAEAEGWIHTEVGDLCPSCARAWDNFKTSFVDRMRKDNGQDLSRL